MSTRATAWVWEHSQSTGNDRLLLLALAAQADDNGRGPLPPHQQIANLCRFPNTNFITGCIFAVMDLGELDIGESPDDDPPDRPWFTIKPLAVTP
jgi:hypothetical protein